METDGLYTYLQCWGSRLGANKEFKIYCQVDASGDWLFKFLSNDSEENCIIDKAERGFLKQHPETVKREVRRMGTVYNLPEAIQREIVKVIEQMQEQ